MSREEFAMTGKDAHDWCPVHVETDWDASARGLKEHSQALRDGLGDMVSRDEYLEKLLILFGVGNWPVSFSDAPPVT
jgi:hypothetical protein